MGDICSEEPASAPSLAGFPQNLKTAKIQIKARIIKVILRGLFQIEEDLLIKFI